MSSVWPLPARDVLRDTSIDWLLQVLAQCSELARNMVIMLVWRIWQVHTDMSHGKEGAPVEASADFLQSYFNSICACKRYCTDEIIKGKMSMQETWVVEKQRKTKVALRWPAPPANMFAHSVDGAFAEDDGSAAVGMILRRQDGSVLFFCISVHI